MNINFILQGKGGIGKSFLASVVSQSLLASNHRIMCIDTDPVNASFASFKSLNVHQIKILDNNKEIDSSAFDKFMELICSAEDIDDVIIDNGAASFIALTNYLLLNGIFDMLQEMGHTVTVHTILVGGQAFSDTLVGVSEVCISAQLLSGKTNTSAKLSITVSSLPSFQCTRTIQIRLLTF